MSRSRTFFILQLFLLLLLLYLAIRWQETTNKARDANRLAKSRDELLKIVSMSTPEEVLSETGKVALSSTTGLSATEADKAVQACLHRLRLPISSFEWRFFGADDQPLNTPKQQAASWSMIWKETRLSNLEGNPRNRDALPLSINFLRGGVGIDEFRGRPGKSRQLGSGDQRTWMYWNYAKPTAAQASDTVAGLMLFMHRKGISAPFLIDWNLDSQSIWRGRAALIDVASDSQVLPGKIPSDWPIEALTKRLLDTTTNSEPPFLVGKSWFLAVPVSRKLFIVASRSATPPQIQPWFWALALLWLGLQLGHRRLSPESLSLRSLLMALVVLIIFLPVMATLAYWHRYRVTETNRLVREGQKELQQNLIQLDESFSVVSRDNQREYNRLLNKYRANQGNMDCIKDELDRLELEGTFDTLFLVSSGGAELRPFSTTNSGPRRIALLPNSLRQPYLEALYRQGYNPHHNEIKFVRTYQLERDGPERFSGYRNSTEKHSTIKMAMRFFSDLLTEFNRRKSLASGNLPKEHMIGLVMSTFLEGQEEDPMEIMLSNLGRFFTMGTGQQQFHAFLDVVSDSTGKGNVVAMFFHQQESLEDFFLRRIFLREPRWPEETRFFAISRHWLAFNYPRLRSDLSWGFVKDDLKPPRRLMSRQIRYRGEDYLMAAFAATNLSNYHLVAAKPLKHVLLPLNLLDSRLTVGAAILGILILVVAMLLHRLLIAPMRHISEGMHALEKHDHAFRISVNTGDEWQSLAEAFNQSLETGEELEVARQVQRHILPQGRLSHGTSSFEAVSRMMSQVGGDFYDAVGLSGNRQMFILGDVSGHGVSAALVVAMAKAAFRCLARPDLEDPAELLQAMNRLFLDQLRRIKMMTCFVGIVSGTGTLRYCNAGHVYPFIFRPGKAPDSLRQVGLPLGISSKKPFKSLSTEFPRGSRLVLFTDGIIEALNVEKEMFGFDRMEELVCRLADKPASDFFREFFTEFESFCLTVEWQDDITIGLLDVASNEQVPSKT